MAFLLTGLITQAQQEAILVLDAKTKQAVPFAHVCIEQLKNNQPKHYITSLEGKVGVAWKYPVRIAISSMGYETLIDTLRSGGIGTLYLSPSVMNMSEVVVTAQFAPEKADRSIYRINVINSRQIEQKAATNLTDLLSGEPNMRISQGGVLGSSLSIQGLSGENVKFLIDGIPVIGRMNGNIDLNQMNLYNVDHVEIIEGPMSVIYGSNAIAGVVNIITRENKLASLTSFANLYHESVGVTNADLGISKRFGKHLLSFDGARNFFSGMADVDTSRYMRWKPRRQYNASSYYLYSTEKLRMKVSGQIFHELLLDKGPLLLPYFESAFDNYFTTLRSTTKLESSYTPRKDKNISLVAAYSSYNRIKNRYLKDLTTLDKILTPNSDDQDTTAISNMLLRAWYNQNVQGSKLNYQAGVDLNLESGSGKRIQDQKQQIGDYAAFLSFRYDPVKSLSLQPGIRAIVNTKYNAPLVYSVNAKWIPRANWTLRLTYAKGFKSPALKELYLYFVDINHNVRGNPNLKAEYSHNLNLTLSHHLESDKAFLHAEAGLFYNNINNNIALAPEGNDLYTYINIGKYLSRGAQANVNWNLYPSLTIKVGVSATAQSYAVDKSSIKNAAANWTKDITGSLSYRIVKQNLTFSAFYKYTGDAPQVIPDADNSISVGWVEDFHTLDASVVKSFYANRVSLTLGGKNLFDVRTVPAVGSGGGAHSGSSGSVNVAWGRTWYAKVSFNLNRYK